MHEGSGPLVRRQKGDDDLSLVATPIALQLMANLHYREGVAKLGPQFHQAQPCVMTALSAIRAEVVRVIDVREAGGLELGVFHGAP